MKIMVPVKRVPDPYGRVRLTPDGRLDVADTKWVINPFDEIALEEAVRIRERATDVSIVAVAVGPAIWEEQLRTALAMGADTAVHVILDSDTDSSGIAACLAEAFRRIQPDLVLMGKQAIDDDCSQVGQRLAAKLGLAQACFASKIELGADRSASIIREVDAGRETITVPLPAVITTDLRLNEPRYVALPAIIKARTKPIERMNASELVSNLAPRITVVRLETPPVRKAGRKVAGVSELVTALREEAGVL